MTYSEKCADTELSRQGTKIGNLTKLFSRLVLYLTVNQRETAAQALQVQHNNSRKTLDSDHMLLKAGQRYMERNI